MSIFTSTFAPHVKNQFEARQDTMFNRPANGLHYLNSRNAWVRMSSSVNVGPNGGTNEIAKKYILQGGTLNLDPAATDLKGVSLKDGIGDFSNAYSNTSRTGEEYRLGIRPMPGITSVDIKSKSAYGSLREAIVNFQCWDIKQLEDLEVLYMRPGYTVLVEWGWTPYLDNGKNYKSTFTDYYDIINASNKPRSTIFKELYRKSVVYGGNYDAMFGYVKNYQWSARMDGGYDCQVTIISTGEIIDSLKVNYMPPNEILNTDQGYLKDEFTNKGNSTEWIRAYEKNILAGVWAEMYYKGRDPNAPFNINTGSAFRCEDGGSGVHTVSIPLSAEIKDPNSLSIDSQFQVYITLEVMFNILNKYIIAKSKTDGEPLVYFSMFTNNTTGAPQTKMLSIAHPLQVSVDPSVCVIKSPLWYDSGSSQVINTAATPINANQDLQQAQYAFDKIKQGWVGSTFDGTYESILTEGCEAILNENQYNYVNDLIKSDASAQSNKYTDLSSVLAGELGRSDMVWANKIKEALEKIPGLTVNVVEEIAYQGKSDLPYNTGNVDNISIVANFPTNNQNLSSQVIIANKSKSAIYNLKFLEDFTRSYFVNEDPSTEIGIMNNIYVNVDFLYKKALDPSLQSQDPKTKNEISLYRYVKNIMQEIQNSIGSINNFEIHVDPIDNNIARVIDVNYTEYPKAKYSNLFQLEVHNLKSIVRSYTLQSQIFPEQGAIIAIGSQAKGGQLGMQTNTMIDFNRNLTDRIIPEKVDGVNSNLSVNSSNSQPSITNGLANIILLFASLNNVFFEKETDPVLKVEYSVLSNNAKNSLRDLIGYFQSLVSSPGSNRNLIPTKFSCKIDGIGGLVIGHMFRLPKYILPKGYRGEDVGSQLGNAITSISHNISKGDWETTIDSLNIVLDDDTSGFDKLDISQLISNVQISIANATAGPCGDVTRRTNYPVANYPEIATVFSSQPRNTILNYVKTLPYSLAVRRSVWASIGIETGWGKSIINNNCNGMQTDGGLWPFADLYIIGVTNFRENKTNSCRSFACYATWQNCVDHVAEIMDSRKQGSGNKEIVPTDPDNSQFFAEGYTVNWIGVSRFDLINFTASSSTMVGIYNTARGEILV
jgi:hypothetical protein